jgi:hypothetical protein
MVNDNLQQNLFLLSVNCLTISRVPAEGEGVLLVLQTLDEGARSQKGRKPPARGLVAGFRAAEEDRLDALGMGNVRGGR